MVVIGKKVGRSRWMGGLLGLIPEAVIAWIVAAYTETGVLGFVGVVLGLLCVYLLIWIKNSLWSWLVYWVAARRQMTAHIEDYLAQNRFPAPPEYVNDIDDYLNQIATSEQYDCPTRVKAAIEMGTLNGLVVGGRMQYSLQFRFAFENALQRYARRFPPSPRHDD
jgi:hypothetical protein